MEYLCKSLLLYFLFTAAWGDDLSRCPSNLIRNQYLRTFRERCYEFVIFRERYWDQAQADCAQTGGRLVTVNDLATQQFLINSLTRLNFRKNGIWIGMDDRNRENSYEWVSGEITHFTYWAPGEPSFLHRVEDCVLMRRTRDYHWEDHACHLWPQHYTYICEFDMAPLPTTTVTTVTVTQPTSTVTVPVTQPEVSVTTGQPFSQVSMMTEVSQMLTDQPTSQPTQSSTKVLTTATQATSMTPVSTEGFMSHITNEKTVPLSTSDHVIETSMPVNSLSSVTTGQTSPVSVTKGQVVISSLSATKGQAVTSTVSVTKGQVVASVPIKQGQAVTSPVSTSKEQAITSSKSVAKESIITSPAPSTTRQKATSKFSATNGKTTPSPVSQSTKGQALTPPGSIF